MTITEKIKNFNLRSISGKTAHFGCTIPQNLPTPKPFHMITSLALSPSLAGARFAFPSWAGASLAFPSLQGVSLALPSLIIQRWCTHYRQSYHIFYKMFCPHFNNLQTNMHHKQPKGKFISNMIITHSEIMHKC